MNNDDVIVFLADEDVDSDTSNASFAEEKYWDIAIVDDDQSVHDVTRLAMKDVVLQGRRLNFISAHSAQQGLALLKDNPQTAVILLDVVMESDDAGLKLVDAIRTDLGNSMVQIVLRTGQAGYAPEEEVIVQYEINAYKTKNELTRSKLFTTLATAVRSYSHIKVIEERQQSLRAVVTASTEMLSKRSLNDFSANALQHISSLFGIGEHNFFCVTQQPASAPYAMRTSQTGYSIICANQQFSQWYGKDLSDLDADSTIVQLVKQTFEQSSHQFGNEWGSLYLRSPSGWEGVIVGDKFQSMQSIDNEILQIFCINVAMGLENAKFFSHLNRAAYHDDLTGFMNRQGLIAHANSVLEKHSNSVALYVVDIDYFHHMVESLGYDVSNAILRKLSSVLFEFFKGKALIARLHADAFAVLVTDVELTAKEVAIRCAKPIHIDNQSIRIGLTVGKSELSLKNDLPDFERMLRHAQIALKVAKENRRGAGEVFQESFELESRRNMTMLSDLRLALQQNELYLVLQPKVDIRNDNKVVGFEALLRWMHPQKGMIPPGAFIPIVEKSGLNYELDLYVARQLCHLVKQNQLNDVPVSFNISANSLTSEDFVNDLVAVFKMNNVPLSSIEVEVTENALIHSEQAIQALRQLYDAGFIICLDDFGAGYSSLSYLLRLPLHIIKIDRAFVADLTENDMSQKILDGMVGIIQSVGKTVVIEGIETDMQLQCIKTIDVGIVQGFFFHKPLDVATAVALL